MTGKKNDGIARSGRFDSADGKSSIFAISGRGSNPGHGMLREAFNQGAEVELEMLRSSGRWSPEMELEVRARAATQRADKERELRILGVPARLHRLLDAVSKREAERLAREMVVTRDEFALLVLNAHTHLGYHHRLDVREFRPEHHAAMFDDIVETLDAAASGEASSAELDKAARKTETMFDERKRVHLHTFKRGAKWHAFFFDYHDMSDDKVGLHIHYLSHRWAVVDFDTVLGALEERRNSLPRGVHLRFERPPNDAPGRRLLINTATGGVYRTVPDPQDPDDLER